MKLQKLVYYAQAWALAWYGAPIFREAIEAWVDGPVVRELFEHHRGYHEVRAWEGDPSRLTERQRVIIDEVLRFYGGRDGDWLSALSHRERPWIEARQGAGPLDRARKVITHEAMRRYYGTAGFARPELLDA